jgi:DNA integrity scanning protein DisA with diadenylate cyclase activity
MTIRDELLALRDQDGIIHPEQVLEWARANQSSDIGQRIQWNIQIAAREYQLEQVRLMIRVNIVDAQGQREYISLNQDRVSGGGYRAIEDVLPVQDLRLAMLNEAYKDLERVHLKYAHLTELARVWDEVKRAKSSARRRGGKRGSDGLESRPSV